MIHVNQPGLYTSQAAQMLLIKDSLVRHNLLVTNLFVLRCLPTKQSLLLHADAAVSGITRSRYVRKLSALRTLDAANAANKTCKRPQR
jgi:hypothetical protein